MSNALLYPLLATAFAAAFIHAVLPTHWLPFVLVGRGQGWSSARTLGAAALSGTALGLLSSTIARTEFQAVLWMALIVLPQVMLCGLLTPREEMAAVLRVLSAAMPLTYAYDLLDRLASGAPLPSGRAALDAGLLAAGIVVPLWAATLTLRRTGR